MQLGKFYIDIKLLNFYDYIVRICTLSFAVFKEYKLQNAITLSGYSKRP